VDSENRMVILIDKNDREVTVNEREILASFISRDFSLWGLVVDDIMALRTFALQYGYGAIEPGVRDIEPRVQRPPLLEIVAELPHPRTRNLLLQVREMALKEFGNNKVRTAAWLGEHVRTLYRENLKRLVNRCKETTE
jgi:hypothetical protein